MADNLARVARHGPLSFHPPMSIALAAPATRFIFRGAPEAARLCGEAFGCGLSMEPLRAQHEGHRAALWLGPDEWLLLALDAPDAAELAASIEAATAPVPHSLVDVSHRQVGVDVVGERAASLLNAGCPLDLDPKAFPVGMSTRTVLAKADITLWRQAQDRFHIEVNRSFAPYAVAFLRNADHGLV